MVDQAQQIADATASMTAAAAIVAGVGAAVQAALVTGKDVTLYLDPRVGMGDDANAGTLAAPLRTLNKALQLAPQGRRTTILLPPTSAAVAEIGPTEVLRLSAQDIFIGPRDLGGAQPTAAQRPVIRFTGAVDGANGNVSGRITGYGNFSLDRVRVEFPRVTDTAQGRGNCFAFSPTSVGQLTVNFSFCELVFADAPAIVANGGLTAVNTYTCTVIYAGASTYGRKLIQIVGGTPAQWAALGMVVPAGAALKDLVQNDVGVVGYNSVPLGLLTNVIFV